MLKNNFYCALGNLQDQSENVVVILIGFKPNRAQEWILSWLKECFDKLMVKHVEKSMCYVGKSNLI